LKGVPLRIAIGPRDIENGTVEIARRDTKEKGVYQIIDLDIKVEHLLNQIQDNIYKKAQDRLEANTYHADTWESLMIFLITKGIHICSLGWYYGNRIEIKEESKATIRCILLKTSRKQELVF